MPDRRTKHRGRIEDLMSEAIKRIPLDQASSEIKMMMRRVVGYLEQDDLENALDERRCLVEIPGVPLLSRQLFGLAQFDVETFEIGEIAEADSWLELGEVIDWPTFGLACVQHLHFPSHFSGWKLDACIELMEDHAIKQAGDGRLVLHLTNWGNLGLKFPEAFTEIVNCLYIINTERRAAKICLDISSLIMLDES